MNDDILQRLKAAQSLTAAERGDFLANIVKQRPNIDICNGRIPTQEEIQTIQRCPLYDGILIIFNPLRDGEEKVED